MQFWKNACQKISFHKNPKITKKYSSKYIGYKSVINIAQNFGYAPNKNLNLYTRQI